MGFGGVGRGWVVGWGHSGRVHIEGLEVRRYLAGMGSTVVRRARWEKDRSHIQVGREEVEVDRGG